MYHPNITPGVLCLIVSLCALTLYIIAQWYTILYSPQSPLHINIATYFIEFLKQNNVTLNVFFHLMLTSQFIYKTNLLFALFEGKQRLAEGCQMLILPVSGQVTSFV